jgi:arsenate reductase
VAEPGLDAPSVRVLFLCVHNSARSQMAEALLRHLGGGFYVVESAGFETRAVLPEAIAAMQLLNLDISQARSKTVFDLFREGRVYDYVITVCDEATAEQCPIFPGICERVHWTFPDPSEVTGTDEERLTQVVQIRDAIKDRIEAWVAEKNAVGLLPRFRGGPTENRRG